MWSRGKRVPQVCSTCHFTLSWTEIQGTTARFAQDLHATTFTSRCATPRENAQMSPKHIALRACKTGSFASVFAMCKGPDDHSNSRFMLSMFANI
jgi:hypothetical protein